MSIQKACRIMDLSRSVYYYTSVKNDSEVKEKLIDLAEKHPKEGQDKMYQRIRNQGILWNYKRVRRIYCLLGLNLRKKSRKRLPARVKVPLIQPDGINQTWSMDFMHDVLGNGRKIRILNIIDDYNREALAVEAHFSIQSTMVVQSLEELIAYRGKPTQIRVDNGPEFIANVLADWCRENEIRLLYIQPGKPFQNGYIERFNRTFRESILDAYLFENIHQVRILAEEFMNDYNTQRPHESLGGLTPEKFKNLGNSFPAGGASSPCWKNNKSISLFNYTMS